MSARVQLRWGWSSSAAPRLRAFICALLLPVEVEIAAGAGRAAQQNPAGSQANSLSAASGQDVYANAKPYLDDLKQIKSFRELYGLKPADSQDQLLPLLDKVGEQLTAMVQKIPDLVSREVVTHVAPSSITGAAVPLNQEYSYLILAHRSNADVTFEEYRTEYRSETDSTEQWTSKALP